MLNKEDLAARNVFGRIEGYACEVTKASQRYLEALETFRDGGLTTAQARARPTDNSVNGVAEGNTTSCHVTMVPLDNYPMVTTNHRQYVSRALCVRDLVGGSLQVGPARSWRVNSIAGRINGTSVEAQIALQQ